jgi:TP901 family phage tail tape measure protein
MSGAFKKMGLASNKFADKAIKNFGRIERKGISLRRVIGGILGAAAVQKGLNLLQQGVRGVTDEFIDFDDAITAAAAKFGIFDRKAPAFAALGETAREVGATTEFTSAQAAEGLRFLAKAGWEADSALKALPTFVDLATAAELDFARASDIATDVMGAFQLKSTDVTENLKQLTRVNDVLAKAVNMSNIDMEDLFETIKFAGPIAKTAGVSLEEFSAMAAFVGGAGLKGSLGGTALRTMFLNLAAPTDKIKGKLAEFNTEIKNVNQIKDNRKALAALGIELDDLGKLSPIKTLKVLNERMKDLSPTARASALNIIFGKRAVSAAAISMDGATGALQDFETQLQSAGGTSKKMATFMRGSIGKRLAELKSAAIELGFKFIDTFESQIPGGIDTVIKAIRDFDIKPIVKAVQTAIEVSREFLQILRDYKGVILGVASALVALKIGTFVVSMFELIAAAKGLAAVGGISGMFAGLTGIAAPVAAVALAVGGLAAGIITLVTYWDDLGRAIIWAKDDLIEWASESKGAILGILTVLGGPFALIAAMPALIVSEWGTITEFFQELFLDAVNIISKAGAVLITVLRAFGGTLKEIFKHPLDVWNTLVDGVKSGVKSIIGWLGSLKSAASGILGTVGKVFGFSGGGENAEGEAGENATPPLLVPPDQNGQIVPPNQTSTEIQRQQRVAFEGQLNIAGAPEGSTFESNTTGAPPIRTEMLGAS